MDKLSTLAPPLGDYARQTVRWAEDAAQQAGVPLKITVTSGTRSMEDQSALRRKWEDCVARGQPGPPCAYPANQPGDSSHNWGLAWDSVIDPELYQDWWDSVRRAFGWEVLTNDRIHAQYPGWRTLVGR